MICVAIQEKNVERCLSLLENIELAEIRIDLCQFNVQQVKEVFSGSKAKLVATCRPDNLTVDEQKLLLKTAVENGAYMIDIEIEASNDYKKEMTAFAKQHNCIVIVSYHNYQNTPSDDELYSLIDECFKSGADIAKIAVQANSQQDSARLLNLYNTNKKILILGMGDYGKITRIAATYLGAPFTFASLNAQSATAPGQIDIDSILQINELLK